MSNEPNDLTALMRSAIEWEETDEVDYPYRAAVDGVKWKIRINDFPDEPLFSLIRDERHIADFDDWPSHWRR